MWLFIFYYLYFKVEMKFYINGWFNSEEVVEVIEKY